MGRVRTVDADSAKAKQGDEIMEDLIALIILAVVGILLVCVRIACRGVPSEVEDEAYKDDDNKESKSIHDEICKICEDAKRKNEMTGNADDQVVDDKADFFITEVDSASDTFKITFSNTVTTIDEGMKLIYDASLQGDPQAKRVVELLKVDVNDSRFCNMFCNMLQVSLFQD